jgi:Ca-activated chloride channel family protein
MRGFTILALIAFSAGASAAAAQVAPPPRCPPNADCVIPMPRPMGQRIVRTESSVRVTLDGRVLRYEITETLVNRGNVVGEADYLLPLPRGAAFEDLALEINGELVTGETMTAERARGIYQEIVRKMRDPALVEWMDHGLLRTRIFPIAPGETKRVEVRFRAVAQREGGALRMDYLAGGRTAGSVEIGSAPTLTFLYPRGDAFGTPYSPTHQLDVDEPRIPTQRALREVRVRGDASRLTLLVPIRDAGRATVAALPYAPPGEDGFALITLSPPVRRGAAIARDVTFVIDVSGSMSGTKIEQARAAGHTLLGTLGPNDRFRLVSFSTDVDEFRSGWTPATGEFLRDARQWIDGLRAAGSTNIEGALTRALEADMQRGRLGLVLFMTDGAATVGERNAERLADLASRLRGTQRVFTFGVGADVQAAMLERMALEGHGTAHFVQPNEDVEHAVGVVAQRLTAPVATNVRLVASGATLRQVHPAGPQDVFVGQDLVLFARYHGDGPVTLTFEGDSPEGPVRWSERVTLPSRSRDNGFVAKLWAVQRVGWLSAERRRAGANTELDNELRELGMKYGIPTELSSYLVLEPGMQPPPASPLPVRGAVGAAGGSGRGAPAVDFAATRAAAEQRAAKSLADANAVLSREESQRRDHAQLRQVGERTFLEKDGAWLDTRVRDSVRRVTVKPFSAAYFDLIEKLPELKAVFALGERVTAGGRRVVVELDAKGSEQLSASELAAVVRDW